MPSAPRISVANERRRDGSVGECRHGTRRSEVRILARPKNGLGYARLEVPAIAIPRQGPVEDLIAHALATDHGPSKNAPNCQSSEHHNIEVLKIITPHKMSTFSVNRLCNVQVYIHTTMYRVAPATHFVIFISEAKQKSGAANQASSEVPPTVEEKREEQVKKEEEKKNEEEEKKEEEGEEVQGRRFPKRTSRNQTVNYREERVYDDDEYIGKLTTYFFSSACSLMTEFKNITSHFVVNRLSGSSESSVGRHGVLFGSSFSEKQSPVYFPQTSPRRSETCAPAYLERESRSKVIWLSLHSMSSLSSTFSALFKWAEPTAGRFSTSRDQWAARQSYRGRSGHVGGDMYTRRSNLFCI
jgi:hypothetical protein